MSAMSKQEVSQEKNKRTTTGLVVSDKMDKTIVIKIETKVKHPLYGKYVRHSSKLHAHDEKNEASMGDTVMVTESRPYSKSKTWTLVKIVEKAR